MSEWVPDWLTQRVFFPKVQTFELSTLHNAEIAVRLPKYAGARLTRHAQC